ncbi:MAG TPA: DinB family protein [Thermoanaerobaculia bacterium]|nr:DinB family protein [Thermoanaerobaculia bacterium]
MTANAVRELFDYDRWANAQVLDVASRLTVEQRSRPFAASYASVHGTLTHILWSEWVWLGRWTSLRSTPDPRSMTAFEALRSLWSEVEAEQRSFLSTLGDADLARLVSYQNPPGTTWTYSLQHMLQHVVNHSTYHRGQLTTMYRELRATPRALDLLVYFDEIAATGN